MKHNSLVAFAIAAAAAAMPPLGQQTRMEPRRNAPGEVLRPPKPKPERTLTKFDFFRLAAADAKRQRRAATYAEQARRGAGRQLATPRKKAQSVDG